MLEAETAVVPHTHVSRPPAGKSATPEDPAFVRLIQMLDKTCRAYYATGQGVPFEIRWRDAAPRRFGNGEPAFGITLRDKTAVSALASLDATTIFEAYMLDHLDFRGDTESM